MSAADPLSRIAAQDGGRVAGRWPVLPIAPLAVAALGIATAVIIASVGARQLQTTSDDVAALRSRALAATLAARIRSTAPEQRPGLLERASRRTGASFLLVEQSGEVLLDRRMAGLSGQQVMRMLHAAQGETELDGRHLRFAASTVSPPLEHLSVMAFVAAPLPAEGTIGLSNAVAVLTVLLIGVAVVVAWLFMRAAREDVSYVSRRISEMARAGSEVGIGGGNVPLRSLDQVGLLTAALNELIERFAAAERRYRADLQQAAQHHTERSQFLAGLSHELRTPLNAILGFTHLLESDDEAELGADAREALAMIRTSGEHLKSLIDDILDLSAMQTGQLHLTRQVVAVLSLAQEVVREVRGIVKDRPVTVRVEGSAGARAWADPRRLRQVISNLVSNALKATVRGEVRVAVEKDADQVVLTVRDWGRGIEPRVLAAIFEPYRQAGDEDTRRGGAGLGLAIARQLVVLHGGRIDVQSVPGSGSLFTVRLPDDSHSASMPRDSLVPWSDELPPTDVGAGDKPLPRGREPS